MYRLVEGWRRYSTAVPFSALVNQISCRVRRHCTASWMVTQLASTTQYTRPSASKHQATPTSCLPKAFTSSYPCCHRQSTTHARRRAHTPLPQAAHPAPHLPATVPPPPSCLAVICPQLPAPAARPPIHPNPIAAYLRLGLRLRLPRLPYGACRAGLARLGTPSSGSGGAAAPPYTPLPWAACACTTPAATTLLPGNGGSAPSAKVAASPAAAAAALPACPAPVPAPAAPASAALTGLRPDGGMIASFAPFRPTALRAVAPCCFFSASSFFLLIISIMRRWKSLRSSCGVTVGAAGACAGCGPAGGSAAPLPPAPPSASTTLAAGGLAGRCGVGSGAGAGGGGGSLIVCTVLGTAGMLTAGVFLAGAGAGAGALLAAAAAAAAGGAAAVAASPAVCACSAPCALPGYAVLPSYAP